MIQLKLLTSTQSLPAPFLYFTFPD